jgi:hypothetical protein
VKFRLFSPVNRYSIIAPYPSMLPEVRDALGRAHPQFLSLGLHL